MEFLKMFLGVSVLSATLRLTVPVLFTAIGGCFGHKANVLNIGLESFLAISAFFAMCGSYWTQNPWVGLLFGVVSGVIASLIFSLFVLVFNASAMVTGIAMNLSAWGFTNFMLLLFFDARGIFIDTRIKSFSVLHIPGIEKIPYIGEIISGHNILVYCSLLSIVIAYVLLYKTPFGLRIRAVGIKPVAAQSVGVNAMRYKLYAILLSGFFSGMGGAFLTIGGSSMFTEKISAGNGFLALAAIMVGNGHPIKTFMACLVFGYVSALSITLQSIGLPSQIVLCFPYIVTVLILFFSAVYDRIKKKRMYIRSVQMSKCCEGEA